jgi:hypothetical protein
MKDGDAFLYDADVAPDPEAWNRLGEHEQLRAIELHHERSAHKDGTPARGHAAVHLIVEGRIATNDPPLVAETLTRLVAEGLARHEAVHAVGRVIITLVNEMVRTGGPFQEERFDRELQALTATTWRAYVTEAIAAEVDANERAQRRPVTPTRKSKRRR